MTPDKNKASGGIVGSTNIICPGCEDGLVIPVRVGTTEREENGTKIGRITVNLVPDLDVIHQHLSVCRAMHDEGHGMTLDELLGEIDDVLRKQP